MGIEQGGRAADGHQRVERGISVEVVRDEEPPAVSGLVLPNHGGVVGGPVGRVTCKSGLLELASDLTARKHGGVDVHVVSLRVLEDVLGEHPVDSPAALR